MYPTRRPCLQLDDRAPDSLPDELPVMVALIEHFLGTSRRSDLGIVAMFPDQQIGGSPYIGIGNYRGLRSLLRRSPCPNNRANSRWHAAGNQPAFSMPKILKMRSGLAKLPLNDSAAERQKHRFHGRFDRRPVSRALGHLGVRKCRRDVDW